MTKHWWLFCVCALAGCVEEQHGLPLVPTRPYEGEVTAAFRERQRISKASERISAHVGRVGQHLATSNRQIGLLPQFITIGSATSELFHIGRTQIVITEGLVKKCENDEQLAALLSRELARMVVEREALTTPTARQIDRSPPQDFPVGNDHRGVWGSVDGTHRMELAKFEMQQKRQRELILPSPSELARQYLKRAGHRDQALDEVEPLLREAERQSTFEKQLSGYGHVSSFANPALELSPPG